MKNDEQCVVMMSNSEFQRGDFVWGKMKGFQWWPAMVLNHHDCKKTVENTSTKVWLFWFGAHTISQIDVGKISHFKRAYLKYFDKCSKKQFVKGVEEALIVLANANDLQYDGASDLLSWGSSGFQTSNFMVQFQWTKSDLPRSIQDVISPKTETAPEETDMQERVITEIQKGRKSLEDICIACCKENVELVQQHPLFVGKICADCKIDVNIACALQASEVHDLCIVCGQGGTLVYCSDEICSRAYCQICIEYLHSTEAYAQILEKDYWQCYFCSSENGECLIQRRAIHEVDPDCIIISPFSVPNSVETANIIKKVLNGEKTLEDICIGCCKEDALLIKPHPLFVGKVCKNCEKDINRICSKPSGKSQLYCIVCGQGGTLLFCSNKLCRRAFCQECIELLHSKEAFVKIRKKDYWQCYLCSDEKGQCLIQRRVCDEVAPRSFAESPITCYEVGTDSIIESSSNILNSMETDDVVKQVLHGEKILEEICIGCCKDDAILIKSHPLFVGKVCKNCEKDIDRICNKPSGKSQLYCIVCGQGGTLLYCSNKLCRRAFCQECIELLHSKESFIKIHKKDYWECYLCSDENGRCLIQRRVCHDFSSCSFSESPLTCSEVDTDSISSESSSSILSTIETDILIKQVLHGEKILEDICIGCCKEDAVLIKPHPLFLGKICKKCEKDVDRICNKLSGKYQQYCIVCGQGGTLVYCSSNLCYRAFCQECIELLHCKQAFVKIVRSNVWMCYLCKPNEQNNCLIRRRYPSGAILPDQDILPHSSTSTPFPSFQSRKPTPVPNFKSSKPNPVPDFKPPKPTLVPVKPVKRSAEIDAVIERVLNGEKSLEDICIACCKENVLLISKHPLFMGSICKACGKDVARICQLPWGKFQEFCIVCGQGGKLVYCSAKLCSRAYCQQCIEYLDSIKSYLEILKNDIWLCFLCDMNENKKCLIRRRSIYNSFENCPEPTASMRKDTPS